MCFRNFHLHHIFFITGVSSGNVFPHFCCGGELMQSVYISVVIILLKFHILVDNLVHLYCSLESR